MSEETKPIPRIANTAIRLMTAEHTREANIVASETLHAMGLSPNDGWKVDIANGLAFREAPASQAGAIEATA